MPGGVHPLTRDLEAGALELLDRAPLENVFLTWLIETAAQRGSRSGLFCSLDGGAVDGVAYFGRQVVLAVSTEHAIAAFAVAPQAPGTERMIVAERSVAERYWDLVKARHRPPRIVRESQPLYWIDETMLQPSDRADVYVRVATAADRAAVADNSAAMIRYELGYDPRADGAFDTNVRLMIERRLWWVGLWRDRYCFFVNAGAYSSRTLQLQGIWTPPELRGKGLASAALRKVCAVLLRDFPTLSLYVNGFNAPAIALYERAGFRQAGELRTYLF